MVMSFALIMSLSEKAFKAFRKLSPETCITIDTRELIIIYPFVEIDRHR